MKHSIFKKVLAMALCVIMIAGTLTACLPSVEFNPPVVGTNAGNKPVATEPTTGKTEGKDPVEDDPNQLFAGTTTIDNSALIYGALVNDVVIGGEEGVAALVPADVKVEMGASALALSIKNVEETAAVEGEALSNLDVHISGIAADNTTPMTVMLGAILPIGLANTELKLYHIENGTPVLMTRVASAADFAIHNQYVYDAETGVVTIYVASFSVFTAVKTTADIWDGEAVAEGFASGTGTEEDPYIIDTAAQLVYFRNQVDAGVTFEGQYVKLTKDIDLDGKLFDPIGFGYTYNKDSETAFMGTFDGGNHTIYNLYQNGWDLDTDKTNYSTYTYSTAGGGLFASIENATIKNLAVSGANIVFECVDIGIVVGYAQGVCHFENIVVTNSTIANYNRATGAVVGEVCYGPYGTDVSQGYSHTFKNITVDSSVVVSSLWGSFDTLIGGVIGGKWGDATVKMENVTTAAELDVYSDVTAAYQWYAYRRCGMLIGHTEQNSPKSALNADAPFLTCENVNVYYGDWTNYTYYEFENQDSGTGKRYPWVRAEKSPVDNNGAFSNPRYGVPTHDGVKVTEDPNMETLKTDYTPIVFNQLYGGGQGVYGKADHAGVTIHDRLTKTIYIDNNLGWTNLKLHYWFANGTDRWTTVVDGVDISGNHVEGSIYKLEIPAYADGFKIVGDGEQYKVVMTPEISLSSLSEKSTYPLDVFQLTLKTGEKQFVASAGTFLINTPVYNQDNPRAERYDVIIYDKSYAGTFETNGYGVAIVLDADGKLIKIYDGANAGYWEAGYTEAKVGKFTVNNYATVAWEELQAGQTLVIFPNTATNNSRAWALALRPVNGAEGSIGKVITITTTINTDIHICSDVCTTCFGCRNKDCTHEDCVNNRCNCLDISIKVDIEGFENTFVVTENNWLYNTQIDRNHYPYASHYQVVVYDKTYTGTFTTNEFGIAAVIDADNRIVKLYNAANGDRSVVYYGIDENGDAFNEVIIAAGEGNNNADYATLAWSELKDGEKLVIFPNHKSDNSARNWAKTVCANWELVKGATAIFTATFKLPTTIYFQNTQDWTNVGIQYWYADGTTMTGVLGSTELHDGLHSVYRIVLPANVVKVAFGSASGSDDNATVTVSTPEITSFQNGYIYISNGTKVESCEYVSGSKTIYFQNNWLWSDVRVYYWYTGTMHNADFPGEKLTAFDNDGTYDYYKFTIPAYAEAFIISGYNHDESSRREQFVDVAMDKVTDGHMYKITAYANGCDKLDSSNGEYKKYVAASSQDWATYVAGYKVVNLKPNANWKKDNARFAVYAYASNTDYVWANLSDKDGDGIYSGWIPTKYTKVIFCRMKANTANDWANKLTQTVDITSGVVNGYTYTVDGKIYFKPNSNWSSSNARFAVYFFNDTTGKNAWASMYKDDATGYYWCDMPIDASWEKMIIVRMNGSNSNNDWSNKWNQTNNLDIPLEGGKTLYTISGSNWGDGSTSVGSWSNK